MGDKKLSAGESELERDEFAGYLADCDKHDLEPNIAGAFRYAWQARAALSQQPECGEGLEVVSWAWECMGAHVTADKVQAAVLQGDGVPLEPLVS